MTRKILTGNALRDWDPPETRAVYWAGAIYAATRALDCYGCKTSPIRPILLEAIKAASEARWAIGAERLRDIGAIEQETLTDTGRVWYTLGGGDAITDVLDALPDSVIEHHPRGLKSLQSLRRAWIKRNSELGDDYARRIGLMK